MIKQENMLDIDVFGEMMDQLIEQSDVKLLIEMPEGTREAELQCNIPGGPVMELYIILNSVESIYSELCRILEIDDQDGLILNSILSLLRDSIKGERV